MGGGEHANYFWENVVWNERVAETGSIKGLDKEILRKAIC